jgi:hypothetical protein
MERIICEKHTSWKQTTGKLEKKKRKACIRKNANLQVLDEPFKM